MADWLNKIAEAHSVRDLPFPGDEPREQIAREGKETNMSENNRSNGNGFFNRRNGFDQVEAMMRAHAKLGEWVSFVYDDNNRVVRDDDGIPQMRVVKVAEMSNSHLANAYRSRLDRAWRSVGPRYVIVRQEKDEDPEAAVNLAFEAGVNTAKLRHAADPVAGMLYTALLGRGFKVAEAGTVAELPDLDAIPVS